MNYKNSVIFIKDWTILVQSLTPDKQLVFWDLFVNYEYGKDNICSDLMVFPIWNFIRTQLDKMNEKYNDTIVSRNQKNGKKSSGRPKKQIVTETQYNPNNPVGISETQKTLNNNNNSNENINDNINEFREKVFSFYEYDKKMLIEFFDYWTEKNKSGKKMRFEEQKFFDIKKRLARWKLNQKENFAQKENKNTPSNNSQGEIYDFESVYRKQHNL